MTVPPQTKNKNKTTLESPPSFHPAPRNKTKHVARYVDLTFGLERLTQYYVQNVIVPCFVFTIISYDGVVVSCATNGRLLAVVQARGLLTRHVIDRYTGFFISRNVAPARVAIAVRAGVLFCFGPVRFCSLRTGVVGARFEPRARARLARSLSAEQPGTLRGSATHDTPPTLRRAPRPPRARRAAAPGGPGAHGMEWNGMECNILSASGDPGARHGDAARGRACRAAAHLVPPRALTSSRNARRLLGVVARRRS